MKKTKPEGRHQPEKILQTVRAGEPSVHHTVQQTLRRLLKWLGCLALGCYVVGAVVFLGIRYWVAPNIDRWREPLQREISEMMSVQVELGKITADWRGLHPRIMLRDTRLRDDDGHELLHIPAVRALVSWTSLFSGDLRFLGLHADGVELSVRRDADDRVSLLGYEVEGDDDGDDEFDSVSDVEILAWLLQQGDVRFTNARILWVDELRNAPVLALEDVAFGFRADGGELQFSMRARPPVELGRSFLLSGSVQMRPDRAELLSLDELSGMLHVNVEGMRPPGWRPWLDVYSAREEGEINWRAWQEVVDGTLQQHVAQLAITDGVWRPADDAMGITAESVQLYVAGPWLALQEAWPVDGRVPLHVEARPDVRIALQMKGLAIDLPELFPAPLEFDDIALAAGVGRDPEAGLSLSVDRAQLRNADMDFDWRGDWQEHGGGQAGLVDMEGRFARLELAAIVRYLPPYVDEDAREWLRHGLLAGRLSDAPVRLRGDLVHFPFGERPDKGDLKIEGPVHGVVIDYAPAALVGPPGWPRLERLEGHAQLHRVDLQVRADTMRMRPGGLPIDLRDVQARIPNIEQDSVLDVEGVGRAEAEAFLSLIRVSPLARLLDGLFDETQGEGRWEVPISLTIPLLDTDDTRVEGAVLFEQAGLRLAKAFPGLSDLNGRISFTEENMMAADGLKANTLGGPVAITGGVGTGQQGLIFDGRLSAGALNDYLDGRFDGMLEGTASYRLAIRRTATGAYGMSLDTPLEGLLIDLPEPLAKPAAARWPLQVQWTPAEGKSDAVLDVRLANGLEARFLHRDGAKEASFFHAGTVNLQGTAKPGASGLTVDVLTPRIDIDAWRSLTDRFDEVDGSARSSILPPLQDLRLQSQKATVFGSELDRLTFTARRPEGQRWRVDVSSTQTAGTLFWQERQGRIQGDIEARFERLALGEPPDEASRGSGEADADDEEAPLLNLDDEIDIPAVRLEVDRLRLYGRDLGALSVVGVNEAQGRLWKLEQLELSSPHGRLEGTGTWRLEGPLRGLRIQADAHFDDLGAWLEQAGFRDLMQGGGGRIQGYVEWRDIPWRFERARLHGDLQIDLAKGRFISLGSRSARLLELLSLQSVKRLASMEWNPAGLMKQGFPFDTLQGRVTLEKGVLQSNNYSVSGPVGTIMIAGEVNLPEEVLDLHAVVVPSLDVSGAAIAAGIAVNPIVGLGAFLTQWLLKDPLSKAMTVEYQVTGDFDAPQIDEISTSTPVK